MDNNDILRKLRYALNMKDPATLEIFKLAGEEISLTTLLDLLKRDDEEGFIQCNDEILEKFLDGLIIKNRGKQEPKPGQKLLSNHVLNNNFILKKIRIALELREDAMLAVLDLGGMPVSKGELSAIFRRPGHHHFKPCGDQMLRNFLKGLPLYLTKIGK